MSRPGIEHPHSIYPEFTLSKHTIWSYPVDTLECPSSQTECTELLKVRCVWDFGSFVNCDAARVLSSFSESFTRQALAQFLRAMKIAVSLCEQRRVFSLLTTGARERDRKRERERDRCSWFAANEMFGMRDGSFLDGVWHGESFSLPLRMEAAWMCMLLSFAWLVILRFWRISTWRGIAVTSVGLCVGTVWEKSMWLYCGHFPNHRQFWPLDQMANSLAAWVVGNCGSRIRVEMQKLEEVKAMILFLLNWSHRFSWSCS